MPLSEMTVVWRVACGDAWADVHEDGRIVGDDEQLCARLQNLLTQPVDVSNSGAGGVPMVLQPTDRRYVVARVRRMVEDEPDLEVIDLYFTGEPAPG
jgi:hypothetical protein